MHRIAPLRERRVWSMQDMLNHWQAQPLSPSEAAEPLGIC